MITLNAWAKVNLSLYITGVREDGYHLLDTVMQSVSLCDTVRVNKRNDNKVNVSCSNDFVSGENNICHKAAELFFSEAKLNGGADIYVEKRIPLAAGLGGGSADAAATLKALNTLFEMPLSEERLLKLALRLGADVPFCLTGGTARVKGIGEEMTAINSKLPLNIVIIKNGEKPSTAAMYKEFDRLSLPENRNKSCDDLSLSLTKGDYNGFIKAVYNDFSYLWDYSQTESALLSAGADKVSLSGSGPSVIGFFENEKKAYEAFLKLKNDYSEIFLVKRADE